MTRILKRKNVLFKNNQLFNSNAGVYSIKWNVVFQWAHLILDWNYGLNYFFISIFLIYILYSIPSIVPYYLYFMLRVLFSAVSKTLQKCQMSCWKPKAPNQAINHNNP